MSEVNIFAIHQVLEIQESVIPAICLGSFHHGIDIGEWCAGRNIIAIL
jgi:hypothetical protein